VPRVRARDAVASVKHPTSSQLPIVASGEDGAVGVDGAVVVVADLFNCQKRDICYYSGLLTMW